MIGSGYFKSHCLQLVESLSFLNVVDSRTHLDKVISLRERKKKAPRIYHPICKSRQIEQSALVNDTHASADDRYMQCTIKHTSKAPLNFSIQTLIDINYLSLVMTILSCFTGTTEKVMRPLCPAWTVYEQVRIHHLLMIRQADPWQTS